jgi:hypothetical protein
LEKKRKKIPVTGIGLIFLGTNSGWTFTLMWYTLSLAFFSF